MPEADTCHAKWRKVAALQTYTVQSSNYQIPSIKPCDNGVPLPLRIQLQNKEFVQNRQTECKQIFGFMRRASRSKVESDTKARTVWFQSAPIFLNKPPVVEDGHGPINECDLCQDARLSDSRRFGFANSSIMVFFSATLRTWFKFSLVVWLQFEQLATDVRPLLKNDGRTAEEDCKYFKCKCLHVLESWVNSKIASSPGFENTASMIIEKRHETKQTCKHGDKNNTINHSEEEMCSETAIVMRNIHVKAHILHLKNSNVFFAELICLHVEKSICHELDTASYKEGTTAEDGRCMQTIINSSHSASRFSPSSSNTDTKWSNEIRNCNADWLLTRNYNTERKTNTPQPECRRPNEENVINSYIVVVYNITNTFSFFVKQSNFLGNLLLNEDVVIMKVRETHIYKFCVEPHTIHTVLIIDKVSFESATLQNKHTQASYFVCQDEKEEWINSGKTISEKRQLKEVKGTRRNDKHFTELDPSNTKKVQQFGIPNNDVISCIMCRDTLALSGGTLRITSWLNLRRQSMHPAFREYSRTQNHVLDGVKVKQRRRSPRRISQTDRRISETANSHKTFFHELFLPGRQGMRFKRINDAYICTETSEYPSFVCDRVDGLKFTTCLMNVDQSPTFEDNGKPHLLYAFEKSTSEYHKKHHLWEAVESTTLEDQKKPHLSKKDESPTLGDHKKGHVYKVVESPTLEDRKEGHVSKAVESPTLEDHKEGHVSKAVESPTLEDHKEGHVSKAVESPTLEDHKEGHVSKAVESPTLGDYKKGHLSKAVDSPTLEDHKEGHASKAVESPTLEDHKEGHVLKAVESPTLEDHKEGHVSKAVESPTLEDHKEGHVSKTVESPTLEDHKEGHVSKAVESPTLGDYKKGHVSKAVDSPTLEDRKEGHVSKAVESPTLEDHKEGHVSKAVESPTLEDHKEGHVSKAVESPTLEDLTNPDLVNAFDSPILNHHKQPVLSNKVKTRISKNQKQPNLSYAVKTSTLENQKLSYLSDAVKTPTLENQKQPQLWIRSLLYLLRAAWQLKNGTKAGGNVGGRTKRGMIKSGCIKVRQTTVSPRGTDFNQNSTNASSPKSKGGKQSDVQSSAVHTDLGDERSNISDDEDDDEEDELTAKGNRIKTNIECMDNFLIIWHSGFLILFLFLLGVGIVLRVYFSTIIERSVKSSANYVLYSHFVKIENVPDKLEFGNLTEVLGESLIILSSLYIGCVLCYMTFLIHRITFTIPLVVIVTGAVVLTEVNIINIYMSPVSAANEEAKKQLKERAEKEYAVDSNTPFSVTYDLISIWGRCCGIVDQYDFQNVMLKYFLPTKSEHKTLQVPPTCCEPSYFEKGVEDVVECASTAEGIFNVGCYQTIYIWLRFYCNLFSIVVILQLLDLCIHIILYKKHLSLLTLEESQIQKLQL